MAATDLYTLGLSLSPDGIVSGGKLAEQALNKVADAADKADARITAFGRSFKQFGASGLLLPSNAEQFLGDIPKHAENAERGLGKVERAMGSLALETVGASNHFGHLGEALLAFGAGGEVVIAVSAGLAVLGLLWEALADKSREAQKAAEEYAKSPAVMSDQDIQRRQLGLPTHFDDTVEGAQQKLKEALPDAIAAPAFGDMVSASINRLHDLGMEYAKTGDKQREFFQAIRDVRGADAGSAELAKIAKRVSDAGIALFDATQAKKQFDAEYENRFTIQTGEATTPDETTTKPLEAAKQLLELRRQGFAQEVALEGTIQGEGAEWEHTLELAKQIRDATAPLLQQAEAARASHSADGDELARQLTLTARQIAAQIQKNDLLKVETEGYKATNQAIKEMGDSLRNELSSASHKMLKEGADSVSGFVDGEIQGLRKYSSEIEAELARPFHEAFRNIQRDMGDFFDYVVSGGSNAFGHLADSIKGIFTRLIAELAAMKLAQNIFDARGLATLGISVPPGYLSGAHGQTLGGLAVAGTSGALGYGLGGMTGNSAVGGGLGALGGAASGAMIGSVIPGIGTAVGAVVGGLAGAIGGLFGSAAKRHTEEVQRELKAQDEMYVKEDAHVRALRAEGMSQEADAAALALQHEQELNAARQKGYDAATLSAIAFAQAAEDAKAKADALAQQQQDALSLVQQQQKVFGYSDAQTYADALKALGFDGMSIDQIKAGYTQFAAGQTLTDAQKDYNNRVNELLSSPGAPGSGSSVSYGSVSQISAAQSDAITGYLAAQLAVLLRIASLLETIAGGGVVTPSTVGAVADSALSQKYQNRRAAVGLPRGPGPS